MNEPSPKWYLIETEITQYLDNHSHELHKFNLRKLQTICAFGESPGFSEGSDGCSPKADHPRRTVGHVPPENFNFQVLRKVTAAY